MNCVFNVLQNKLIDPPENKNAVIIDQKKITAYGAMCLGKAGGSKSVQAAAKPHHAAHCYNLEDLAGVEGCNCCLF